MMDTKNLIQQARGWLANRQQPQQQAVPWEMRQAAEAQQHSNQNMHVATQGGGGYTTESPIEGAPGGPTQNQKMDLFTNFKYPTQWADAEDVYKRYASGEFKTPEAWSMGQGVLGQMAQTGNPVDVQGWWDAQQDPTKTYLSDMTKELAEQAGVGGVRFSTPLQRNIADQSRRAIENLTAGMADRHIAAQEAARGRQLGATGQLFSYGSGMAGLESDAANRAMSAAGGLGNLGSMYFQAPMQVAGQMANQGAMTQQMRNQQLQQMQNNPWQQGLLQYLMMSQGGVPQMYQPSFLEQMLGAAGQAAPYLRRNEGGGADISGGGYGGAGSGASGHGTFGR